MGHRSAYCSICGGPFNAGKRDNNWTFAACLLTPGQEVAGEGGKYVASNYDPKAEDEPIHLLQIPANWVDGHEFNDQALSGYSVVRAFWPSPDMNPGGNVFRAPLYLPVHQACMQIVNELITQRSQSQIEVMDGRVVDHASLWRVLSSRFQAEYMYLGHLTDGNNLPEPNDFHGARQCRKSDWEADEDPDAAVIFEADPCAQSRSPAGTNDGSQVEQPASPGLQNRQRIWRILETARIGDIPATPPRRALTEAERAELAQVLPPHFQSPPGRFQASPGGPRIP